MHTNLNFPVFFKPAARTALAAVISLFLTRFLKLEYGYWAVISSIIVMQANLGGSIRAGWRRIVGTTIGAAVGTSALLLLGNDWWVFGLAIFLTISLTALLTKRQETYRMSAVSTAIVMLAWQGAEPAIQFGLERCAEISIGVGVAVGVSLLVWPSRAADHLRNELADELRALALWQESALLQFLGKDIDERYDRVAELSKRIRANDELHEQAMGEMKILRRDKNSRLLSALGSMERVFGLVRGLSRIATVTPSDSYQSHLENEIWGLGLECSQTMRILADRIQPGLQGREDVPSRLPVVVEALEDRLNTLRSTRTTEQYPLMDVANVFAYVQTLKSLAVELEWLALKW